MQIRQINASSTLSIRHQVLWPNKPIEFCKVDEDELGVHFGAFKNEQLVCVASVFITASNARLRKFATLPQEQGKGIGSAMIRHIIEYLTQRNIDVFWCDARESAIDFYHKFDMHTEGERFYKSEVAYFKMILSVPKAQR
ncbi:GNAT family N-acetyltransferase [Vibrio ezurae]|uniref:N-acetyltransferase domain-containing protein n=1 Tax=Vibrio ezurae NBRC 102218 TaxID=1219080 RepID=U3CDQ1_9VIBR|nr:GNAT family N-acetyltransferase [Vibrio ezurae]GAD79389.1 hypothetical protein VEZ01S_11_00310 [Vibrio ezurae NBRC 102218]